MLAGLAGAGAPLGATAPAAIADAVSPPTPVQKAEPSVASITASRAALQKEIATTRAELAKLPEGLPAGADRWLTQETALLERIDAVLAEQQRTWQHAADLTLEAAEVGERTRNQRPAEATFKPPFDLPLLDQLYTELDALTQSAETLKRDVDQMETAVQETRDLLEEKDRDRRAIRGAPGGADTAGKAPGNLRLAELESRLAQETLLLREKSLKTLKLQQSLLDPKQKLLRPRLEWLRAHLTLDADAAPAASPKRLADLERAIAAAKTQAEAAAQFVVTTERRSGTEPIAAELESRRASRQTANLTLSVLTAQRERLTERAKTTALRRRVLGGEMSGPELRVLARENLAAMDQLVRERRRATTELFRSRRELQDWQGRLAQAAAADEKAAPWSVERVKRLAAWIELSQAEVSDLERLRSERSRLQEEIGTRVSLFSWREATARGREDIVAAWNFEVFSVQDQPVRVKTMVWVLLLVVVGYHAARWITAQLSLHLLKRFGMHTGRRAALQSLWFYALFVVVLVVAFNLFHISLTQFSVVSGALAVGIGFGSQNLIGNFISGIILLIERPVNQGDVIEIEGRRVTVERLGARSTIVRTLDNTHMVVPNSRLLDQPVINWTLSDEVVRQQIRVGVAYGSPTRKVAELLQAVLEGVETVRPEPKPLVKFADFGDSSLIFDVYFWASIEERLETENELRHRIAETFSKAGIVMAFPQRDVHLETTKPLHVVITPAPGPADPPPPA
jgi:small-conductance mechanosensitive channel